MMGERPKPTTGLHATAPPWNFHFQDLRYTRTYKMANVGRTEAGPPKHLTVDPSQAQPPTRDLPADAHFPNLLADAKETKVHPSNAGGENASLLFVGTATTILYVSTEPEA